MDRDREAFRTSISSASLTRIYGPVLGSVSPASKQVSRFFGLLELEKP